MTQFAIWFSVPSGYVYLWDESAMTCLQFVFSVPSSGYVHNDDEPAMNYPSLSTPNFTSLKVAVLFC